MDTINTPTIRKKIKKLESMEPKESRRIWQHVTEALGNKDVEAATDAKHTVSLAVQMYLYGCTVKFDFEQQWLPTRNTFVYGMCKLVRRLCYSIDNRMG